MKSTTKKTTTGKKALSKRRIVKARAATEKGLENLRQYFVEKGPDGMEEIVTVFDGPVAMFAEYLSGIPFSHLGSRRPHRSIQEQLITMLKKSGAKTIDAQYTNALRSARGAFFDAITADMLRFLPEEPGLSMALWRALIIQDPSILPRAEGAVEYVVNGMLHQGFDFLDKLVDDRRNFGVRRKDKTGRLNELLWMLAANWTNPEFPLWLMQTPAICSSLKLLGATSPLAGSVNKLIERAKLTRGGRKNPIKDVRVGSGEAKRCTFVLKGTAFVELNNARLNVDVICPLAQVLDTKVISTALEFEAARREQNWIRRSLGADSAEFKAARKLIASKFHLNQIKPLSYRIRVDV